MGGAPFVIYGVSKWLHPKSNLEILAIHAGTVFTILVNVFGVFVIVTQEGKANASRNCYPQINSLRSLVYIRSYRN